MNATLIVIDSDAELARARKLVNRLMASDDPADIARLTAQARLIAAYEESKWPRRPPRTSDILRYLMDQYGLSRADMVPILGTASRWCSASGLASACQPISSCLRPEGRDCATRSGRHKQGGPLQMQRSDQS